MFNNTLKLTLFILLLSSCAGVVTQKRMPASEDVTSFILPESDNCFVVVKEFIGPELIFTARDRLVLKEQLNLSDRFMDGIKADESLREIASVHNTKDEQEKAWLVIGSLKRKNPEANVSEIKKLYNELLNPCD